METGDPEAKRIRIDPQASGHAAAATSSHPSTLPPPITPVSVAPHLPPQSSAEIQQHFEHHQDTQHRHLGQQPAHLYAPGHPQAVAPSTQQYHQPPLHPYRDQSSAQGAPEHRPHSGHPESRSLPDPASLGGYPNPRAGYGPPTMNQAPPARSFSVDSGYQRGSATPLQVNVTEAQRRPPSTPTSIGHDGSTTPMEHGHSAQMYQIPPDHMHNGLPNGYAVPPGHETYPGTPVGPAPPGAYGPSPYQQGPFSAGANAYNNVPRRKQVRAIQACNACRQRKQKCDEARPCSFCHENNMECLYRDIPPQKSDRSLNSVMDAINALADRMGGIEQALRKGGLTLPEAERPKSREDASVEMTGMSTEMSPMDDAKMLAQEHSPTQGRSRAADGPLSASLRDRPATAHNAAVTNDDAQNPASTEESVVDAWGRTLLQDHTTPAHQLLDEWPCMEIFRPPTGLSSDYPLELETARGLLRLYGRGEGNDAADGGHPGGHVTSANSPSDGSSPAPSQSDGLWGTGFVQGFAPGLDPRRGEGANAGGLGMDGFLYLEERVVRRLVQSYLSHMHILHPFLNTRRLQRMVDAFVHKYCASPRMQFAPPPPRNSMDSFSGIPLKRKHSSGPNASLPSPTTTATFDGSAPKRVPERSISNAIVLLVLALGRVCEHKTPLPGVVPNTETMNFPESLPPGSHVGASPVLVKQSPSASSPTISVSSPGTETKYSQRSGRSSVEPMSVDRRELAPNSRNVDVIPGLAYYAFATDILGNLHNGSQLTHCQAFLLAALYMGQLGRALESWKLIQSACLTWKFLALKMDPSELSNRTEDTQQDLTKFAFWTCQQLESDIHAELSRLPLSGLSKWEELVMFPSGVVDFSPEELNRDHELDMMYYSAQIVLRKTLNRVHRAVYGKAPENAAIEARERLPKEYHAILEEWRRSLPPALRWNDTDPPAKDINAARIRAKYYGARYVINRPFLMRSIHLNTMPRPVSPPNSLNQSDLEHCRICITAAKHSTIAFDNVPDRLIVTNIWGTAHAQFGNMLVLAATYNCNIPQLRALISFDELQKLMARTIKFLERLAPLSPVLRQDREILAYTWTQVSGSDAPPGSSATSSFAGC